MAWPPANYLFDARFFGKSTFVSVVMANHNDLGHKEHHLIARESTTTVLHMLNYVICILEMLPNKLPDTRVVRVHLVAAIGCLILCHWATNRNIVNEGNCGIRNLRCKI